MNDQLDPSFDDETDLLSGSGLVAEKAKRLAKLAELRGAGDEPYPYRFDRTHTLARTSSNSTARWKPALK